MIKEEILNKVKNLNKVSKEAKIAVICGGKSAEREVSLRSGKNCLNALLEYGYKNVISLDMDNDLPENLKANDIEIAFLALHGTYGEDGCIQGLLESLEISYTGCGVMSSSVCMNKNITKKILQYHNIPCPKTIDSVNDNINYPVFCKPVDQGSSLGAGLAHNKKELVSIIDEISKYTSEPALIEEYIEGRELTIGVLQLEKDVFATDILEIEVKNGNYDYKNKYTPGALIHTSPAKIDEKITEKIKELAVTSFKSVNCSGFARIDVILNNDSPYIIEINTLPGMTDQSDLPCQSKTFGIDYNELVNLMLHSSLLKK